MCSQHSLARILLLVGILNEIMLSSNRTVVNLVEGYLKVFSMKNVFSLSVLAAVFLLTACGPATKPLTTKVVTLEKVAVMPSAAQINREKTKVVVLPLKGRDRLANQYNLGGLASNKISHLLTEAGVEVVDRALIQDLRDEMERTEFEGALERNVLSESADYSLVVDIAQVAVTSTFTESKKSTDKNGEAQIIPAVCTYSGGLSGTYKVINNKNGRLADSFTLSSKTSTQTESSDANCLIREHQMSYLVKQAIEKAVEKTRYDLKNFFAPKGYVASAEQSVEGQEFYVQISLGRNDGVKPKDKVVFFELKETLDQVTGDIFQEEVLVADGNVTTNIGSRNSWVIVDNTLRARMKAGLIAKISYDSGTILDRLGDYASRYDPRKMLDSQDEAQP